ncbi:MULTISPECIES: GNAT family N-acetyltransferase [unclassified Streptomyces]|uniref:GNAT family N-acetyltransferase n=1 Tax=unclassified Streptomyces TaxID=2593676 RepID=UPI0033C6BA71
MSAAEIRHRRDGDMEACVDALATVHEADRYPAEWPADPKNWLTPHGLLDAWVAVDGPTVLGHVALTRTEEVLAKEAGLPVAELASVARLFARSEARRRGVASALLDTVRAAAAADGVRLVLEAEEGGAAAIAFYERAGWRYLGSRTDGWTTADGRVARMRAYMAPVGPVGEPSAIR